MTKLEQLEKWIEDNKYSYPVPDILKRKIRQLKASEGEETLDFAEWCDSKDLRKNSVDRLWYSITDNSGEYDGKTIEQLFKIFKSTI